MPNKIFEMKMRMNKMILKDHPDVPFVFKGGTSLLFRYKDFPRLSQDIDIALDEENWEGNIELIIQTLKAKGYTVDEDEKEGDTTSTKDIDTMLNLEIFKNIDKHEEVSDFKNIYDQWGKEEFIENEKPSFDEVINSIKEIVSYWGVKDAN